MYTASGNVIVVVGLSRSYNDDNNLDGRNNIRAENEKHC